MSKHPERARDYLGHILTALERIQKYSTEKTAADFAEEKLLQDRVLRNLGIIGERLLVCLQNHPILRPGIRRFRWPRSTPCAIGSRTRAKKWTWTSSGTFRSVSAVHYTLAGGPGGRCRRVGREPESAGGGKSELRRAVCRITSGTRASRLVDGQCHRKDTASATPRLSGRGPPWNRNTRVGPVFRVHSSLRQLQRRGKGEMVR